MDRKKNQTVCIAVNAIVTHAISYGIYITYMCSIFENTAHICDVDTITDGVGTNCIDSYAQ